MMKQVNFIDSLKAQSQIVDLKNTLRDYLVPTENASVKVEMLERRFVRCHMELSIFAGIPWIKHVWPEKDDHVVVQAATQLIELNEIQSVKNLFYEHVKLIVLLASPQDFAFDAFPSDQGVTSILKEHEKTRLTFLRRSCRIVRCILATKHQQLNRLGINLKTTNSTIKDLEYLSSILRPHKRHDFYFEEDLQGPLKYLKTYVAAYEALAILQSNSSTRDREFVTYADFVELMSPHLDDKLDRAAFRRHVSRHKGKNSFKKGQGKAQAGHRQVLDRFDLVWLTECLLAYRAPI